MKRRNSPKQKPSGLTIVKAPGGLPFLPNMERDDHFRGDPDAYEATARGGVEERGLTPDTGSDA
jgi:hypothetical protein